MINIRSLHGIEHPSFYMGVLTSIREFDRREVEGVLSSLLGITQREECFCALYLRAQRNVDTLMELKNVAHFQATAMLARGLFELRMDMEMLAKTPDGDSRLRLYKRLELLRAARSLLKHEEEQSGHQTASERRRYIADFGLEIEQQARALWSVSNLSKLRHWTGLNVAERAKALGDETQAMYAQSYQQFSWYVHSGIQGTLDAPADHFPRICGVALSISVLSYSRVLTEVARATRITTHDQDFDRKLELALGLPQAESEADELKIRRFVGL